MIVNLQDIGLTSAPYIVEVTFFNIIDYYRFRKHIFPHFPKILNKDTVVIYPVNVFYEEPIAKIKFTSKTAREDLGKSLRDKDYIEILDYVLKKLLKELIDLKTLGKSLKDDGCVKMYVDFKKEVIGGNVICPFADRKRMRCSAGAYKSYPWCTIEEMWKKCKYFKMRMTELDNSMWWYFAHKIRQRTLR